MQSGYKRKRKADYTNQPNKRSYPAPVPAPGSYLARTSAYPMYKYISPIAKKLTPGPNVKKTEYHAAISYPQYYINTPLGLGPDPDGADVASNITKGCLFPHIIEDARAQCLTLCGQGNTSTDRVGNAVDAKGIQLYIQYCNPIMQQAVLPAFNQQIYRPSIITNVDGNEVAVGTAQRVDNYLHAANFRIVVLMDKDFTGGKPPTVSQVFADGALSMGVTGKNYNNIYNTTCQLKPDATQRYLVLMNKMVAMDNNTVIKTIKKNIKLDGVEIRYNQGNANAAPQNGAQYTIWMFILSDVVNIDPDEPIENIERYCPTYSFTSRFRFMPK